MKIAIYTLGCKVNQYETQAMERELVARGHTLASFEESGEGANHTPGRDPAPQGI